MPVPKDVYTDTSSNMADNANSLAVSPTANRMKHYKQAYAILP